MPIDSRKKIRPTGNMTSLLLFGKCFSLNLKYLLDTWTTSLNKPKTLAK